MKVRIREFVVLLIILAAVAVVATAQADDDQHPPNDLNSHNIAQTAGDIALGGDDSLALGLGLSYGMGDVDINEGKNCMGSEQKANVLFGRQKMALNAWCAALFYELNGKHTFAAKLRCEIPEIGRHYTTANQCVIDQDLSPAKTTSAEQDQINEHVASEEQHTKELVAVQEQQMGLVAQVDYLTAQFEQVQAQPMPEPAQQELEPRYTEEDVAYVLGLYVDGEEEDE